MIKMQIKRFILIIFCISLGIPLLYDINDVSAHSPTGILLKYWKDSSELNITINHIVADPQTHYIKNIEIRVNDSLVIDQDYTSQPTTSIFNYTYSLVANEGATIYARATCSITGSISETITLGDSENNGNGTPGAIIPGFDNYLIVLFTIGAIFYIVKLKNKKEFN